MPIRQLGKRREALMGISESYKRKVILYLEARGFYLYQDSFVEGTFADGILKRKDDDRPYWLEVKATNLSIRNNDFVREMGIYLKHYLELSKNNKFKFILAIKDYQNPLLFEKIYEKYLDKDIKNYVEYIMDKSDIETRGIIQKYPYDDIKKFFEETEIIRATEEQLQIATELIIKPAPIKPKEHDAQESIKIIERYRNIKPLKVNEVLYSNLLELNIPSKIYYADSKHKNIKLLFESNRGLMFPIFRLLNKKIYSFYKINQIDIFENICFFDSVKEENIKKWDTNIDTKNIILFLLYKWIDKMCINKSLLQDRRTKSYYLYKDNYDDIPKSITWQPRDRRIKRDVVIPMKSGDETRFWSHRGVRIYIKKIWGEYFIQIIPRWLFSSDGMNLFNGETIDKLDRSYRKSAFNRNMNQYNDFLFWSKFLFPEGMIPLYEYFKPKLAPKLYIKNILSVETDMKPNLFEHKQEKYVNFMDPNSLLEYFFEENKMNEDELELEDLLINEDEEEKIR